MYVSSFTKNDKKLTAEEQNLQKGVQMVESHPLFSALPNKLKPLSVSKYGRDTIALTESDGTIYLNQYVFLTARQWAHVIAHNLLHHAFGHFDLKNVPGFQVEESKGSSAKLPEFRKEIWNQAADIYITKFLADMKFGEPFAESVDWLPGNLTTELEIYHYLLEQETVQLDQRYGTASLHRMDMVGLDKPLTYGRWPNRNPYALAFTQALERSVADSIDIAGGYEVTRHQYGTEKDTVNRAARWFIDHYPLLGGLAASFQIIEDAAYCVKAQIQVAAIDISKGRIYVNPAAGLSEEEWKFVLAHEYIHAGLNHHKRCGNREFEIFNIACDFVINAWLVEMRIGQMPSMGLLYDPELENLSAETIYDMLMENLRKSRKLSTFRGYGKGDMMEPQSDRTASNADYTTFDEICREALLQGLEYHQKQGRGLVPAGMVEEIRALAMPPIPWDVALANLFQMWFPLPEKKRSYSRPSRRQGATPDIPRPRYMYAEEQTERKTFGVVIDTSGSMNATEIGIALGAIASYAAEREVPYVRVVFCDAAAYDAGYLSVDEIAGIVEVKGRGGTRLQPAIDLLEAAEDFPKDGPILLITDGQIESKIMIHREHAWLIPEGKRLPFRTKASIFSYR